MTLPQLHGLIIALSMFMVARTLAMWHDAGVSSVISKPLLMGATTTQHSRLPPLGMLPQVQQEALAAAGGNMPSGMLTVQDEALMPAGAARKLVAFLELFA